MFRRILEALTGGNRSEAQPIKPKGLTRADELMATIDKSMAAIKAGQKSRDEAFIEAREAFLSKASSILNAEELRLLGVSIGGGDRYSWSRHPRLTYVKSLPADDLPAMFRAMMKLRDALDWVSIATSDVWETWHHKSPDDQHKIVLLTAEATMAGFCEVGFKPDEALAEPILRFLSTTPCHSFPRDMASDSWSINILRRLNLVFKTNEDLPEAARPYAIKLAKLALGDPAYGKPAQMADNAVMSPKAKALMALAGLTRDSLLGRMRRLSPPRLGGADFYGRYTAGLPALERISARMDQLITEFVAAGGKPDWVTSEEAYAQRFDTEGDKEAAFGWWMRDRSRDAGPNRFHKEAYEAMCREGAFDTRGNWLKGLRDLLAADESWLPWAFGTDRVPDVEAFTFGGADTEGRFLEHLSTATATKPSKAWLKTAAEHIGRIDPDRVEQWFGHWLCHAVEIEDNGFFDDLPLHQVPFAAELVLGDVDRVAKMKAVAREYLDERFVSIIALRSLRMPYSLNQLQKDRRTSKGWSYSHERRLQRGPMSEINVAVMTGVLWASSELGARAPLSAIVGAAKFCFAKYHGEFRSRKAGNAALWTLALIGRSEAVNALARIRRSVVRDKAISKEVDKALAETGRKIGLSLDDMHELSAEDWGIGPGGIRRERLGDWEITLRVASTRSTVIESRPWGEPEAAPKRGIPKAALIDDEAKELADDLTTAAKDIPKLLREVRARFDVAARKQRGWSWAELRERFFDNHLVATLSHRIIWSLAWPDGARAEAIWMKNGFQDATGKTLDRSPETARLSVWHPLLAGKTDAIDWADHLAVLGIRQPFPQAWRPIYQVTPPELQTRTYSNRFAGHILHQPAFVAVLRRRGWTAYSQQSFMVNTPEASNRIDLPAFGVCAQFWAAGIGASGPSGHDYGGHSYDFVTTDRIVFFALNAVGVAADAPLELDKVPAIAFSEVMRDVELAIGIASIGRDQFWADRGTNAAHPSNQIGGAEAYRTAFTTQGSAELIAMRHKALGRFLPALRIGPSTKLSETEVEIKGRSGRLYAIHLGSAAVHMLPGRRHLCIVAARAGNLDEQSLPFEGDAVLAEILSKLFLLSEDTVIDNEQIRKQIGL